MIGKQQYDAAVAELESAAAPVRTGGRFLKMIANSDG